MLNLRSCLALSLAVVTGVLAIPLEVYLLEEEEFQRVWYGDGVAYVGPNVPSDVEVALNITFKSSLGDWLLVESDQETNPPSSPGLRNPTFLVGNVDQDAQRPFYFAHSAVDLTEDDIYMYRIEDLAWKLTSARRGRLDGGTYLVPTETEGTYTIRWLVDEDEASELGGKAAVLSTWND